METPLFEQVGELTRTLVGDDAGEVRFRAHRRGVKVWFGGDRPGRFHYEAQLIPRRLVDGRDGAALEIGFHAEHGDVARNDAVLSAFARREEQWRSELGDSTEAGAFLGRPDDWRRVSETWLEFDLDDPEASFEIAARLTDYVRTLEPLRPAEP